MFIFFLIAFSFFVEIIICLIIFSTDFGLFQFVEFLFNFFNGSLDVNAIGMSKEFKLGMSKAINDFEGAPINVGAPVVKGAPTERFIIYHMNLRPCKVIYMVRALPGSEGPPFKYYVFETSIENNLWAYIYARRGTPVVIPVDITEDILRLRSKKVATEGYFSFIISFNNIVVFDTMQFFFLNFCIASVLFFLHICFSNAEKAEEDAGLEEEAEELDRQAIKELNLRVAKQKYDEDQQEFERQWADIRGGRSVEPYTNIEAWKRDHASDFEWVARGRGCSVDEKKPCKKPWI